ncbi:hypothetical protein EW146_g3916 [Bondarzewia mesenterica]|uniref:Uncharacterized protein n=1 Tax=Bondarzewia mesenterica TaxID=1095465 RepID=A0A4V3XFA4_9AGAM|nr:hypothetical protein EW146_g3916 [Bondarzewia mesenterica]
MSEWLMVLTALFCALPLREVSSLSISSYSTWLRADSRALKAAFSRLQNVQTISAFDSVEPIIMLAMRPDRLQSGYCFPLLQRIRLGCRLGEMSAEAAREIIKHVADCLQVRQETFGIVPLSELSFSKDHVPKEYLEDLKSFRNWMPPPFVISYGCPL